LAIAFKVVLVEIFTIPFDVNEEEVSLGVVPSVV
jgi:hypothetical protein